MLLIDLLAPTFVLNLLTELQILPSNLYTQIKGSKRFKETLLSLYIYVSLLRYC